MLGNYALLHSIFLKSYIDTVFQKYDKDKSGSLDAEEMTLFWNDLYQVLNIPTLVTLEHSKNAIKSIDLDGSGSIDKVQLFKAFQMISKNNSGMQNALHQQAMLANPNNIQSYGTMPLSYGNMYISTNTGGGKPKYGNWHSMQNYGSNQIPPQVYPNKNQHYLQSSPSPQQHQSPQQFPQHYPYPHPHPHPHPPQQQNPQPQFSPISKMQQQQPQPPGNSQYLSQSTKFGGSWAKKSMQ